MNVRFDACRSAKLPKSCRNGPGYYGMVTESEFNPGPLTKCGQFDPQNPDHQALLMQLLS